MGEITAKELADAIGYEPYALRAMLRKHSRDGLGPAEDPGRGYYKFSPADVATFAIFRPLMRIGLATVDAFNAAKQAMGKLWGSAASAEQIVRQMRGKLLEVTHGVGVQCQVVTKLRAPSPMVTYIDLAQVVIAACTRLVQIVDYELPPLYYVEPQKLK